MTTVFHDYVDCTPTSTGSWQTQDLSAVIASGATGVALVAYNSGATNYYLAGACKPGIESGNPYMNVDLTTRTLIYAGVNSSREVKLYRGNADIHFALVAEFGDEAVFFDSMVACATNTTATWVDTDVSASVAANADAGFFLWGDNAAEVSLVNFGMRLHADSEDTDILGLMRRGDSMGMICDLDANGHFDQQVNSANQNCYLVGYLVAGSGWVFEHPRDSLTSTAADYYDLTALPAGTTGAIFDVKTNAATMYAFDLRAKGATGGPYQDSYRITQAMCGCDASGVVQAKRENANLLTYVRAYYVPPAVVPVLIADQDGTHIDVSWS